tara:strand:- start:1477 stop:2601 length:1125 start_codon:yes stop_codon:yes gene_type:complete
MDRIINIGITINFDTKFFSNGLQQNVIFLNDLINQIESFRCFYLWEGSQINKKIVDEKFCFPYKRILQEDSIDFDLIIMMGFTFGDNVVKEIKEKNKNTKIVLMQCGNQFVENMNFSLFDIDKNYSPLGIIDNLDQIWILPHYEKNISYMKTYYKNVNTIIVPYIWDSFFIDLLLENSIYKNNKFEFYDLNNKGISIMEPNLQSSKNCILPLFIVESFEQEFPNLLKSCNVFCADKLAENDYFIKLIIQMDIYKKKKDFLKVQKRITFLDAITKFGSIIISHQQDNALNYLYLESLYLNLPILHNSDFIKDYGYYYPENDIDIAKVQINKILKEHKENISNYFLNSRKVINKFSPKNPDNINAYKKILSSLLDE